MELVDTPDLGSGNASYGGSSPSARTKQSRHSLKVLSSMHIQNTATNGLKQEFKVTVPFKSIEEKVVTWLQDKAKSVRLDGFRPGKAPLNIVRQRYEEHALQAIREQFVQTGTQQIYKENNVRVAGQPVYDFGSLDNDQDFSFSISFETLPSFELKEFSKIKLETFDVKATPEAINESLERLAEGYKQSKKTDKAQPDQAVEINDDFAKEFGCKDLEDLREKISSTLKNDYDRLARLYSKRHLLDALAAEYDFDLPSLMVKNEFDAIWQRLEQEMADAKANGELSPEEENKPLVEYKEEYQQISERRVRLGLVVAEVAKKNGITLSPEMVRDLMIQEAMRYPGQEKEVVSFYRSHPEMIEQLTGPAIEDKVVDFIMSKAAVKKTDITFKELQKKLKGILPQYAEEDEEEDEKPSKAEKPKKTKKKPETEAV